MRGKFQVQYNQMKMTSIPARACPDAARFAGALGGAFLVGLLLCGCQSPSPYEGHRSWAVRQSETPPYAADYDLLYFYPQITDWRTHAGGTNACAAAYAHLKPFGLSDAVRDWRQPRIFAPYVTPETAAADIREAIRFYLETYHEPGRLYAIVAEGESAAPARAVVEDELGWCGRLDREDGFFASFFVPEAGAVDTEDLARFLRRLVRRVRLGRDWRRTVPADVAGIPESVLEAWHERGE